jgi:mono/diheme cytochrome c family protein
MNKLHLLPALALGALVFAGAAAPPKAPPEPPAGFALKGDARRGAPLFAKHCAICHGEGGHGDGRMAKSLKAKPRDFTDAERMAGISDWEVYLAIRDGGQAVGLSPVMFGWSRSLSDQQIHDLAAFVRTLSAKPSASSSRP